VQELLIVIIVMQRTEASREAKIGQFDMAAVIQQDIVWLDISGTISATAKGINKSHRLPMDEAKFMDCLNSQYALSHIETGNILGEDLVLDQHGHQVASWQKLHEHIEEVRILERGEELYNPRTLCLCQNIALGPNVCELIFLKHLCLDQ
jgi:hypothetical protein